MAGRRLRKSHWEELRNKMRYPVQDAYLNAASPEASSPEASSPEAELRVGHGEEQETGAPGLKRAGRPIQAGEDERKNEPAQHDRTPTQPEE